jgi:hypothetical protein
VNAIRAFDARDQVHWQYDIKCLEGQIATLHVSPTGRTGKKLTRLHTIHRQELNNAISHLYLVNT